MLYSNASTPFHCTAEQAATLDAIAQLRKGGIGTVHGYQPASGWVDRPIANIQGIFRFSTERLYQRRIDALDAVDFGTVADAIANNPKLAALATAKARDIFDERKAMLIASLQKTLAGDRSDSYRQGHDRCYATVSDGVKVHFVTEKDGSGIMQPITESDGNPIMASIMLPIIELSRKYVREGTRKVVNSGPAVLMGNAIERALNSRSVSYRALSLKGDNFDRVALGGDVIVPEDVADLTV